MTTPPLRWVKRENSDKQVSFELQYYDEDKHKYVKVPQVELQHEEGPAVDVNAPYRIWKQWLDTCLNNMNPSKRGKW